MQSFHISRRKLLGEISILGKLLLVMPVVNAVGERSFSALRQGKTYFSSTTGDSRLDHHMMLHVHRDGTDAPTLVDGANDSLGRKKTERCCLEKSPRTISQTGPLFRQSQHKREIRDKKKRYCRQMYWFDMYQGVRINRRTEAGGELTWATCSPPSVMLATGLQLR